MSFVTNNTEFGIVSDSEIISIINNFSDEMIIDIIHRNAENKFRPYQYYVGNLINAIESSFKANEENYPQFYLENSGRREEIYTTIIKELCQLHGLEFSYYENTDLYSLAYFLYDFTISKFTINLVNFFANYIVAEKDAIYNYLNMNDMKRNKDSSSVYSKKIFKGNQKLGVIHANMELVVDAICGFDIDMKTLIAITTYDQNIVNILNLNFNEISNLFKTLFVPYVKDVRYHPIIVTMVRMRLQEMEAVSETFSV